MNTEKKPRRLAKLVAATAIGASALSIGAASTASAYLHPGSTTQYPSSGGTWTYGFWNAQVRSYYYNSSRCHGSTVDYNSSRSRSADTAAGYTSVASLYAINLPGNNDRYYYRTC
jgi:hypothetical protein